MKIRITYHFTARIFHTLTIYPSGRTMQGETVTKTPYQVARFIEYALAYDFAVDYVAYP